MNNQQNTSLKDRLLGADRPSRDAVRTTLILAALLAVLIVVNLLVGLVPKGVTLVDVTDNDQFTVSATTKDFVKKVKEDVTIYVLCPTDVMTPTLDALLARYQMLNSHIHVKTVDALHDTEFQKKFSGAESMSDYSIIVESARRYRMIDSSNMYYYIIEGLDATFTPQEYYSFRYSDSYVQIATAYYQQYGLYIDDVTHYCFRAEEAVSEAIDYVTAESIPHTYVAKGHNEKTFGKTLTNFLSQVSLVYEDINLRDVTTLPSDMSTLVIYAPATDFTESEADMVISYLSKGGNVLLITSPENATMPNLARIAAVMGLSPMAGVIHEGNANRYVDVPTALSPDINAKHTITSSGVSNKYAVVCPNSHGISAAATLPANVTVTALFTTSDAAYVVAGDGKETDIGATAIAVAAQNSETGAKLTWFASAEAFEDALVEKNGGNSLYYMAMALYWQSKSYTPVVGDIASVDLTEGLLEVNDFSVILLGAIFVLLIPAACLAIGLSIRARRKRR